ncbi:MAG: hypothetical protein ABIB98_00725 [bacterium]
MPRKILILSILIIPLIFVFFISILLSKTQNLSFKNLTKEEKYQHIIEERDLAIAEAVDAGNYKCCIKPPCTMCFMEANQWNNFTPGICACDNLIAQGKEPCPQCQRELCGTDKNEESCHIESENQNE